MQPIISQLSNEISGQVENIQVDKLLSDTILKCGLAPYSELVSILGMLRALEILHQTHHWQAEGSNFYSDHLLFGRLYEAAHEDIDSLGEKIVGLGNSKLVGFSIHAVTISSWLVNIKSFGTSDAAPRRSLEAEQMLVSLVETVMERLKQKNLLTRGLENLLGGIADKHEGLIYLLKQRDVG